MEAKQVRDLMEAYASVYTTISEDHFKVGDEVTCKASGMEGEVIKLDKPSGEDDEKYYTVKREDGKTMKYSANELKLAEKEKEDVKEAKNGGASKKSETKFHLKLDNLVHKTFGSSPEEKKMKKEEVETDLFDYLLEYLVAEGYADTNKAALAIMANMSEEWRQSIVEQLDPDSTGGNYGDFQKLHQINDMMKKMSPAQKKKYLDGLPRVGQDGKPLKGA